MIKKLLQSLFILAATVVSSAAYSKWYVTPEGNPEQSNMAPYHLFRDTSPVVPSEMRLTYDGYIFTISTRTQVNGLLSAPTGQYLLLQSTNASFNTLIASSGTVPNLYSSTATLNLVIADGAYITELVSELANITTVWGSSITYSSGTIYNLISTTISARTVGATTGNFETINSTTINVTGDVDGYNISDQFDQIKIDTNTLHSDATTFASEVALSTNALHAETTTQAYLVALATNTLHAETTTQAYMVSLATDALHAETTTQAYLVAVDTNALHADATTFAYAVALDTNTLHADATTFAYTIRQDTVSLQIQLNDVATTYVKLAGDTMVGDLIVNTTIYTPVLRSSHVVTSTITAMGPLNVDAGTVTLSGNLQLYTGNKLILAEEASDYNIYADTTNGAIMFSMDSVGTAQVGSRGPFVIYSNADVPGNTNWAPYLNFMNDGSVHLYNTTSGTDRTFRIFMGSGVVVDSGDLSVSNGNIGVSGTVDGADVSQLAVDTGTLAGTVAQLVIDTTTLHADATTFAYAVTLDTNTLHNDATNFAYVVAIDTNTLHAETTMQAYVVALATNALHAETTMQAYTIGQDTGSLQGQLDTFPTTYVDVAGDTMTGDLIVNATIYSYVLRSTNVYTSTITSMSPLNIQADNFQLSPLAATFNVPGLLSNGSVGAPAFAFTASTMTGIYRTGAAELAIAHENVERLRIGAGETFATNKLSVFDDTSAGDCSISLKMTGSGTNRTTGFNRGLNELYAWCNNRPVWDYTAVTHTLNLPAGSNYAGLDYPGVTLGNSTVGMRNTSGGIGFFTTTYPPSTDVLLISGGRVKIANGTVGTPGLGFVEDNTSGMWRDPVGLTAIGFSLGGYEKIRMMTSSTTITGDLICNTTIQTTVLVVSTIMAGSPLKVVADRITMGNATNTTNGANSVVSGGSGNAASWEHATVAGGMDNTASGEYGTVSGGRANTNAGRFSAIVCGYDNDIPAGKDYAFVGAGTLNVASIRSSIVGGENNITSGDTASILGGYYNTASGDYSSVIGGRNNIAAGYGAFAGTGQSNNSSGQNSFIGAGNQNESSQFATVVCGGQQNHATFNSATVGGGQGNWASGYVATVPGGWNNQATGYASFAAGYRAIAGHQGAITFQAWKNGAADFYSSANSEFAVRAEGGVRFVTGSTTTQITDAGVQAPILIAGTSIQSPIGDLDTIITSTISGDTPLFVRTNNLVMGDLFNKITSGNYNSVLGGSTQTISSGDYNTIAGGYKNTVSGDNYEATLGGTNNRIVNAAGSIIVGGDSIDILNSDNSFVGGGSNHTITFSGNARSGIIGGSNHSITGAGSFSAGGSNIQISGNNSAILGSANTSISGSNSTWVSGQNSTASGNFSFGGGYYGMVDHSGCFLWSDTYSALGFHTLTNNEFAVRATGGFRFVTSVGTTTITSTGVTLPVGTTVQASFGDFDKIITSTMATDGSLTIQSDNLQVTPSSATIQGDGLFTGKLISNTTMQAVVGIFTEVHSTGTYTNYIQWNVGAFTVGIDTPTTQGIEFLDSNYDKYVSTGTTNAWDWKKLNP